MNKTMYALVYCFEGVDENYPYASVIAVSKNIEKLRKNYAAYIEDISKSMYLLEDQVFSLYYCFDSEQLAEQYPPLNNSQDYYYKLQHMFSFIILSHTKFKKNPFDLSFCHFIYQL